MSVINILDQQTANLIAAGEVVDRPAAVAKELLENAIDAGGTKITIEIKNGGSSLIRVTDNGKGMSPDDVKTCVLRHATSKIKSPEDLEGIATLGFRGEALAAISAVSRFQVISKESSADFGVCMLMEGENTVSFEEVGCPDGTTITVRDIFFNVPARRKFLKKDTTETAYISQYVERIAISHPEIALKFIVDSRVKFSTPGNNELRDAVYSVYGREFVDSMTPIERDDGKIKISGFVSIPDMTRINRNHQIIFVNNRLVRSRIVSYAVEDAYKSYIMTDRYPAFIIFININPYLVDINVHPTKLEVRFVDDASVRESVYFAVKNVLESRLNPIKQDFVEKSKESFEAQKLKNAFVPIGESFSHEQQELFVPKTTPAFTHSPEIPREVKEEGDFFSFAEAKPIETFSPPEIRFSDSLSAGKIRDDAQSYCGTVEINNSPENSETPSQSPVDVKSEEEETVSLAKFVKYRGIVFNTYVIAEYEDSMYIIDKHAAHERIIYEALKRSKGKAGVQTIINTRVLHLTGIQFDCAVDNIEQLQGCGFDIEVFGDNTLAIRGVPTEFSELEISECEKILLGMIDDMLSGKSAKLTKDELFDRTLYTAACKAATKAGYVDSEESYVWLINKLFEYENVFCCPHGRPIIVKYTKNQIEKMFNRT
ncbi:MAG: DNA mismatch repair endonuclease MutL [Clostridia bacterium]|nr:DNA mismatch repair endonuclease MutL [Clostridia bacterium]